MKKGETSTDDDDVKKEKKSAKFFAKWEAFQE
jgi:hypothetical protein